MIVHLRVSMTNYRFRGGGKRFSSGSRRLTERIVAPAPQRATRLEDAAPVLRADREVDVSRFRSHAVAVIRHQVLSFAILGILAACGGGNEATRTEKSAESPGSAESTVAETPDSWAWHKLGLPRGLPEPEAAGDGVLAPAVLEDEGVLHLWYTQKTNGSPYALMHSESRDGGESFATPALVTGLGNDHMNAYPTVWREGGVFKLLFGSGSIRLATSDDGVRFTPAPTSVVLRPSFDATRFDARSVLYPSHAPGESAVFFFTGFDGVRLRIGRAALREDGVFVADPPRPVIDIGAGSEFDNSAAAAPHVQRVSGRWWMWYGGYDTSQSNPGPYRIGHASSKDGVAWTKHGVAVDLGASGTDAWSTRDPVLVASKDSGGRWLMFYVGLGDDGRYRLHRAASDDLRQ
jgi:hypothetical protein